MIVSTGIATAIAGHGAASSVLERADGHRSTLMWWWIAAFLALTLVFYALYDNPFPHRLKARLRAVVVAIGALPWIVAAAAALSFYGTAAFVHRLIVGERIEPRSSLWYVGSFLLLVVLSVWLRNNVVIVHTRYLRGERIGREDGAAKPLTIVAILSDVSETLSGNGYRAEIDWSSPPDLDADLKTLEAAKKRGAPTWSWEMLLRALRPHAHCLDGLVLVGSREPDHPAPDGVRRRPPSLPQAFAFVRILRSYPQFENVPVSVWAEQGGIRSMIPADDNRLVETLRGFDFGDLDEMSSTVADLIKYLRFEKRIAASDLLIDFTGGTKPVSVVAAAATMRGEIRAQYVDTNDVMPTTYDLVANPEARA
jgi:hypothetical protein